MKFLADMNMSLFTVEWLRANGHNATSVREHGMQQAADDVILGKARVERCILLTMDLDFGYLMAISRQQLPSIILFRLGNETSEFVNLTNEVLFIKSGRVRVDFYDDHQNYLESRVLHQGDVLLLATGGHGFEMLEPTEMIEVKQRPYAGDADKTRFVGITAEQARIPSDHH
jgi:predicted nuclease of predicted toxin-antitoxin system